MASQKARSRSGRSSSGTATRAKSAGQSGSGRGQNAQARRGQNGQAGQAVQTAGSRAGQSRVTAAQARSATQAAPPTARPPARLGPPLWFQLTTLVLSLGGLGVSIYLTVAHYTTSSILACSDNGLVDCAKVTTSAESVVFGIFPVAVLGLAFYVFMTAVNTPWAWRSRFPLVAWGRTVSVIVGILFVLYLIYAEVIEIGNICLWCTSVHVITFLLFVLLMAVAPFTRKASGRAVS